jgi:hypothetical protein
MKFAVTKSSLLTRNKETYNAMWVTSIQSQSYEEQLRNLILIMFASLFDAKPDFPLGNKVDLKDANLDYFLKFVEDNQISFRIFALGGNIADNIKPKINKLITNEVARLRDLKKSFKKACKLFNDFDIKYIVVKSFRRYPLSSFTDYDFIIPDELDRKKALRIMKDLGYTFLRGRFCEEPYKCSCHKGHSQIDIYPRASWNRMKVIETNLLFNRKQWRSLDGLKVYVPSAENELIILTSHSFAHLYIKLSEIFEALAIFKEELDWKYIIEKTMRYGTIHSLYYFLHTLDRFYRTFYGKGGGLQRILKTLQHWKIIRIVQSTMGNRKKLVFPYRFPTSLIFVSMVYRLYLDIKNGHVSGVIDDVESHSLMIVLRLLEDFGVNVKRFSPRVWSIKLKK